MQIFANPECTRYADGSESTIYARINVPWLSPWNVESGGEDIFFAFAAPYGFSVFTDWANEEDSEEQFVAGQVVAAVNSKGHGGNPGDITQVVFTRQ